MSDGFVELAIAGMHRDIARERVRVDEERQAERQAEARALSRGRAGITGTPEQVAHDHDAERLTLASSRPAKRRWRELDKFDSELAQLHVRLSEAGARVIAAEADLVRAPQDDAASYAAWVEAGEQGDPPTPCLYDRQVRRDAAQLAVAGVQQAIDRLTERRAKFVTDRRTKFVADARADREAAQDRYAAAIQALAALRGELIETRATEIWATCFPDRAATEQAGFVPMLALGLRGPVQKALGIAAQTPFAAVLDSLEADAATIATLMTDRQAEAAGRENPSASPESEAMWTSDPRAVAWSKAKLEELREIGRWGGDRDLQQERPDL